MGTHQKAYFLLPNTDIAPGTIVRLGQIISSPRKPHRPIVPFQDLPSPPLISVKRDYELTTTHSSQVSVGLIAHFLAQLGSPCSGGLSMKRRKTTSTHWKFKTLETVYFEPDQTFVDTRIQDPSVKQILGKRKLDGNVVYLITGLKIARGGSYCSFSTSLTSTNTDLTVDATSLAGVPVSAGPQLSHQNSKSEQETAGSCTDFVWAIRVRKIRLTFWNKRMQVKDLFGGELSSLGKSDIPTFADYSESEDEDQGEERVENVELDESDVGPMYGSKGFNETVVDESGEECSVFW